MEKAYTCEMCGGKKFPSLEKFEDHKKEVHPEMQGQEQAHAN
jgi:hypothetical protein